MTLSRIMDKVIMADNGRLVVPAHLRQQLGMSKGGKMIASIRDGVLMLEPFDVAVRRAQAMARSYLQPGEGSVVEEFLAERRREAQGEAGG
jgi:bifunctional DNA-binding transcriptional regulator/antitoxin component of YhaV-PrlF toxin-antitoxin module